MMRQTLATGMAILVSASTLCAQQAGNVPSYAQQQAGGGQPRVASAAQGQAAATQNAPPTAPFTLTPEANAQLQRVLLAWQQQSQGTKTLECKFTRWHFDMFAAPAGLHATRADGVLKYAAPDRGLFRVDQLVFFAGMDGEKPHYKPQTGQYGEHWVCNGQQLIEMDRSKEECRIQDLPPEMQGKNIISSPLPFVFNLDAAQIQQRYWIRQVDAGTAGIVLIEAWPKRQEDRAQYKLVQIALEANTFLPQALKMYAPNFDFKTAPKWDQYEFTDVKRNSIGAALGVFMNNFVPEKPPASWKILRDKFVAPVDLPPQQAANPAAPAVR
ncbi:MAG: TIGR03009 domain-containing protein [Rubripirellula sp.]